MAGPDAILRMEDISATYDDGGSLLPVLAGVSLRLESGEFAALLGPSGSGKSTLLKIAAGLICPDRGRVFLNGRESTGQIQKVGYMPQQDLLLPWKTLLQNAALPLLAAGIRKKEAYDRVRMLLPVFGLEGFEDYYPRRLSGGMRQRTALLRTVMIDSSLLLLDEPFAALDAMTREKLQEWLLSVLERFNRSVLFVTHSIDEAIYLSDRVYTFSERPGTIVLKQQIELPRPRSRSLVTSASFLEYKQVLMESLQ
jgi:ABC-type nitrate/sulfonate/bicarbonate transport system ATPase subunit